MRILILIIFLCFFHSQWIAAQEDEVNFIENSSSIKSAFGNHGMVICNSALSAQTALSILKKGGNAIDAAIAANAVMGVIDPTSGGVGGDLFALIWDSKSEQLFGINGCGRTPKLLTNDLFKRLNINHINADSPLSVTVPGCVDAWNEMYQKFGLLPISEILQDAISTSENGFIIGDEVYERMQNEAVRLAKNPQFFAAYLVDGQLPEKGSVVKNHDLSNLFKDLSINGFRSFYDGKINQAMQLSVKEAGGYLSSFDITNHHSEWVEPVSTDYHGNKVCQLPPNGMGINVLIMLEMLEHIAKDIDSLGSKEYYHTLIELNKQAFGDQDAYYEDPTFRNYTVSNMLSLQKINEKIKTISVIKASDNLSHHTYNESNTISVIVADQNGNLVILCQNNYIGMGSGIVPTGLGFVLQNRAASFTLRRNQSNTYAAGKRPYFSSMPCVVLKDNKPLIAISLSNNQLGAGAEFQLIVNTIDYQLEPMKAIGTPYFYQSKPFGKQESGIGSDWTNIEKGLNYQIIRDLISMGHHIKITSAPITGLQTLFIKPDNPAFQGLIKSNKKGLVVGY